MYELYKTSERCISAIFNGLAVEPYAYQSVYGFVPVLEYQPVPRGVLYKPGGYYEDVKNRFQSNLPSVSKKPARMEIYSVFTFT
jgi:hypothetical protein